MSFNSSSTLLAASSDAMRLVVVWAVAGPGLGQRVASFSLHNRPVLPLRFLPPAHPLTALQHGLAAAIRAATATAAGAAGGDSSAAASAGQEALASSAAAEQQGRVLPAARALQMHAGAAAVTRTAVAAADVLRVGAEGVLRDRLLAYCELYGGLHLADMRWVCLG